MNHPAPMPTQRRRNASRKKRRGFTLLHVLTAMPLLVVFIFIGSKLFLANYAMLNEAAHSREQLTRTDAVVHKLRLDAWRSTDSTIRDGQLTLTTAQGAITWRRTDEGGLERTGYGASDPPEVYKHLGVTGFASRPGAIVLTIGDERLLCPMGAIRSTGETRP